jgi:hypothetical protein
LDAVSDVNFSGSRPPEVVLPDEAIDVIAALQRSPSGGSGRAAVAEIVVSHPTSLFAWAEYGDRARDDLESYMSYRVGYHRGLDALRQNGWRGSGYVRWSFESNRGFLRCLLGLARTARLIGEDVEAQRCRTFLAQLDPSTNWDQLG